MRAYELMIILNTELGDAEIQARLNRIDEQVAEINASVASTDKWGRRRFAYEINHMTEGFYVVLEILSEDALDEIERTLRLDDGVVRHKVLRLPDHEAERRGLLGDGAAAAS
ncbi:MAG: 30S ribosomal protein S6 [Actinomycetia bacterium]|nr:30S ribosomal protein S6 [Actinomycetes bacterium]MCP4085822.1 30S ribosomal protein S6 [Actinomycetes bacterium]